MKVLLSATRNINGVERRVVATVVIPGEEKTPRDLGRQSEAYRGKRMTSSGKL